MAEDLLLSPNVNEDQLKAQISAAEAQGPAGVDTLGKLRSELEGRKQKTVSEVEPLRAKQAEGLADLEKASSAIRDYQPPSRPDYQAPSKWQDSEEYKSAQVGKWGVSSGFALMMVSLVGAYAMKTGAKGAMSAMTAAMKGWSEGNTEKWQQALDTYDRHVKFIQEQNTRNQKEYDRITNDDKLTMNEKFNAKRLYLSSIGAIVRSDDLTIASLDKMMQAIDAAVGKLKQKHTESSQKAPVTLSKADLLRIGVEYAQTGKMPIKLSNRKEDIGNRDAVERAKTEALAYYEKNGKWPEVPTSTAKGMEFRADTSSVKKLQERNTMIQAFAETAEMNFDTIVSESKKLEDKGKLPTFKKSADIVQAYQVRWSGDPEVIPYVQAVYETALEYAKVVQGNTGNQALSDSAREEMLSRFAESNSAATVKATADMSKKLVNNRLVGFKKVNDSLLSKYKTSPGAATVPRGTTDITTPEQAQSAGWKKVGKSKSTGKDVWRDKDGKPHVF